MPHPIKHSDVIDTAVSFVARRQIQGRPTTMRQLAKRVGLGASVIKSVFEEHGIQYVLIPYGEGKWAQSSIEIALMTLPEKVALRNGYTVKDVEDSYEKIFNSVQPEPLEPDEEGVFATIDPVLNMDPYGPYRIGTKEYQTLKHELIDFRTLVEEGKKKGYPYRAIQRATGGDRMRYKLPSPIWRPYVYKKKRFYLREVLNHLNQVYKTYKRSSTADLKRVNRNIQQRARRKEMRLQEQGAW